jgi:hypothetical protein
VRLQEVQKPQKGGAMEIMLPANLSRRSHQNLKAWLDLMIQMADPDNDDPQ